MGPNLHNNAAVGQNRFEPLVDQNIKAEGDKASVEVKEASARPRKRSIQVIGGLEFRKKPNLSRFLSQSPKTNVRHFKEWRAQREFKHAMRENLAKAPENQKTTAEVIKEVADSKAAKARVKGRHMAMTGGGNIGASTNEVVSLTFHRNIGNSGSNIGYFKASLSPAELDAIDEMKNPISQEASGIGLNSHSKFAERAVLTGKIDGMLGLNVVTHDQLIEHDGKSGILSPQAQGTSLDKMDPSAIDLKNEKMLKGLFDLQVLDHITGQVDRHTGNIFIGDDGTVTGIDHDLSFGNRNTKYSKTTKEDMDVLVGMQSNNKGLPQMVDKVTAEAVKSLSTKDFRAALEQGGLQAEAIAAAESRLEEMKSHLENNAVIVQDWSKVSQDDLKNFKNPKIGSGPFHSLFQVVARVAKQPAQGAVAANANANQNANEYENIDDVLGRPQYDRVPAENEYENVDDVLGRPQYDRVPAGNEYENVDDVLGRPQYDRVPADNEYEDAGDADTDYEEVPMDIDAEYSESDESSDF